MSCSVFFYPLNDSNFTAGMTLRLEDAPEGTSVIWAAPIPWPEIKDCLQYLGVDSAQVRDGELGGALQPFTSSEALEQLQFHRTGFPRVLVLNVSTSSPAAVLSRLMAWSNTRSAR